MKQANFFSHLSFTIVWVTHAKMIKGWNQSKGRSSFLGLLTALQAADAQSLSGVQCEAVVAVLDVCLAGHGVEVGLQRELCEVSTGLYLQVLRWTMHTVLLNHYFILLSPVPPLF